MHLQKFLPGAAKLESFLSATIFAAAIAQFVLFAVFLDRVRYSILVALLHVGLLALLLPVLARLASTSQRRIALLGAGTALAGVLLILQIVSGRYAIIDSGLLTNAIAHFEQTRQ